MDKIEKALRKLTVAERAKIKKIFNQLLSGDFSGLNIKKLKDRDDIFRVRFANLRIIFQRKKNGKIMILHLVRRNERTYKF
ncbi:MAG: hypothetical protein Athens101428_682 [Candidatus Berkelbacteria bacterium Athens1014_28]|uniref:Uncharacterized protein n=1 Tax=Candidatus Berkelbacteria bacterium Athens1014_28 TaxID=2017145 RepID=A0A554LKN0_9BACT|nr:MAG: hypothetical protein Athens101428_682 [Candidatus Berkelbacteria bacterium Athens1014_28]